MESSDSKSKKFYYILSKINNNNGSYDLFFIKDPKDGLIEFNHPYYYGKLDEYHFKDGKELLNLCLKVYFKNEKNQFEKIKNEFLSFILNNLKNKLDFNIYYGIKKFEKVSCCFGEICIDYNALLVILALSKSEFKNYKRPVNYIQDLILNYIRL